MADWQVGDLALCVKVGAWSKFGPAPKAGEINVVDGLYCDPVDGSLHLGFAEYRDAFLASRFRKVTPPKADAFDREVIALMAGEPAQTTNQS